MKVSCRVTAGGRGHMMANAGEDARGATVEISQYRIERFGFNDMRGRSETIEVYALAALGHENVPCAGKDGRLRVEAFRVRDDRVGGLGAAGLHFPSPLPGWYGVRVGGNITAVNTYAVILPLNGGALIVVPCYESPSSPAAGMKKQPLRTGKRSAYLASDVMLTSA